MSDGKPETPRRLSGEQDGAREKEDARSPHLPMRESVQSLSEFTAEAARPAGRYTSPEGVMDRLILEFQKHLADFSGASAPPSFVFNDPLYPVPPQWQAILDYLHAGGFISSRQFAFEHFFNDEPKIFSLRLFSVFGREPTDGRVAILSGHSRGVSRDFDEAMSKVIGEFLERYPLTIYRRKDLLRGSMKSLARSGKRFLDINDLAGFSDWQKELYPQRRFDESSNVHWIEGEELLSGQPAFIPAQLVFWNYNVPQEPSEPYLRQPNTNGAAGHFTDAEAILAGIYENIQRDAFLIHWLNSMAPPRIDNESIQDAEIREMIAYFSRYGFETIFLNTTLDMKVPSCACVLVDTSGRGPKVSLGGGCGPVFEHALMRSITEALGVYHWLRLQPDASAFLPDTYVPFRDASINQDRRLLLWGSGSMFSRFEPFLSGAIESAADVGKYPQTFASPEEELGHIQGILREKGKGYEVYVYKAKHRMLADLGYVSARVIIPALVPLYLNEPDAPLGAPRLFGAPKEMGLAPSRQFNPWPHPFP